MKTNGLISERVKVDSELLVGTTAASTSLNYDMRHYNQALISVAIETTVGISTVSIDLMESSAATVAGTSAAGGKAGIVLGGVTTLIPTTGGVRQMTITMTSLATDLNALTISAGSVIKKFTNTTSTALFNSSAWASTNLYFGSTVGSTANTGLALSIDALKTAIESTLAFGTEKFVLSTGSTASLTIQAADAVVGNLGFNTTNTGYTALVNQAVGAFNIADDELTSTANKRYIGVKVSTKLEATRAAITVIRTGGSYKPPTFSGKLST